MSESPTTEYLKPLPNIEDPDSAPFWEGTRANKLLVQRCENCGYHRWPPGATCPECQTRGGEWVEVSPTGTLYSYATYHRALDPKFKDDIPYTVGYIQLEAGPRMIGVMIGAPDALVVDGPVRAVFEAVTPEVTLVRWEMSN